MKEKKKLGETGIENLFRKRRSKDPFSLKSTSVQQKSLYTRKKKHNKRREDTGFRAVNISSNSAQQQKWFGHTEILHDGDGFVENANNDRNFFSLSDATAPQWARASSLTRFLDHTQRRTTVGRIPLDEWSARRRDLYLTTYNTHKKQTSMPPVGFEPTTSAGERSQTYALDRAVTGTGNDRT